MFKLTFENSVPDLAVGSEGLEDDDTFRTALLISLLTDRRAAGEDPVRDPKNLRGWWGDSYPDVEGDQVGSRLWLLSGAKTTDANLALAEGYALEALQWLIEDGAAQTVVVTATRIDPDVLELDIAIERPDEPAERYLGTWDAQLSEI